MSLGAEYKVQKKWLWSCFVPFYRSWDCKFIQSQVKYNHDLMNYAVFTCAWNMLSLNTNEACFTAKLVHTRWCIAQNMIETCLVWSWLKLPHEVVSIMIRQSKLNMVAESGEGQVKITKTGTMRKRNGLVKKFNISLICHRPKAKYLVQYFPKTSGK